MKKQSLNSLSETIKNIQRSEGITQREFAARMDVSIKTIQNWEYGGSQPTKSNIRRMIDIFELKEENYPELFEYVSSPQKTEEKDSPLEGNADSIVEGEDGKAAPLKTKLQRPFIFLKNKFNTPMKISLLLLSVLLIALGVFVVAYICYSATNGYGYSEFFQPLICIVAGILVLPTLIYFIVKKVKKYNKTKNDKK